MERIETIGQLRRAIANCSDDQPCFILVQAPPSKDPCSFEDEYGPGSSEHFIDVNTNNDVNNAVLLHIGEEASYPEACE